MDPTYFCTLLGTWPPGLGVPCSGPSAEYTHPYMTSRRCRTQRASGKCESSLGSTRTGAFPSSFCKPFPDCIWLLHKSLRKAQRAVSYVYEQTECSVTVVTSLQTSGDPQAFSHKTKAEIRRGGGVEDGGAVSRNHNTIFTLHNVYNNHSSLLTVTHTRCLAGRNARLACFHNTSMCTAARRLELSSRGGMERFWGCQGSSGCQRSAGADKWGSSDSP